MTDGELLGSFVEQRDEGAFELLVRRHGAMVLGVCRRILGDLHDAEDAFQATFLVLARRAAQIGQRELVGNWLYGVASRTAMELKTRTARRRCREKQVKDMPHPTVEPAAAWDDLQPLLDQEVGRLPDKYRIPVVLCDLEGRSRKEVALELKVPEGTLSSRLATARKMLARKLAGRGVVLSGGVLAMMLTQKAAAAVVSPALVASTVKAAVTFAAGGALVGVSAKVIGLVEAVVQGLLTTKTTKSVMLCLAAVLCGLVAGQGSLRTVPLETAPRTICCQSPSAVPRTTPESPPARKGTWIAVAVEETRTRIGPHQVVTVHICGPDGVVRALMSIDLGSAKMAVPEHGRIIHLFTMAWAGEELPDLGALLQLPRCVRSAAVFRGASPPIGPEASSLTDLCFSPTFLWFPWAGPCAGPRWSCPASSPCRPVPDSSECIDTRETALPCLGSSISRQSLCPG